MKEGSGVKGTIVSCSTCDCCCTQAIFSYTHLPTAPSATHCSTQASDILILIDEFFKNFTYDDLKASPKQRSWWQLFVPSNQASCRVLSTQKPCKSKQGAMGYRLWPRAAVCLAVLFCLGVESHSTDGAPFTNKTVSHIPFLPIY